MVVFIPLIATMETESLIWTLTLRKVQLILEFSAIFTPQAKCCRVNSGHQYQLNIHPNIFKLAEKLLISSLFNFL
jgi:hypothetical protein